MPVSDKTAFFCNGYGLFFKTDKEGQSSLFATPWYEDEINIDIVTKILNSYIMHYYITATSVSIEGGYPCYQKNFIDKFTIPELSGTQLNDIRAIDGQELDMYLVTLYALNLSVPKRWR